MHGSSVATGTHETEVESLYGVIGRRDGEIHAYITLCRERARGRAKALDSGTREGKAGRLVGVGIAVKDNICVSGLRSTCASRMLEGYSPPYDATVISKLESEGAVVLGKTNMDEFAMGNTTQTSYFGPTRNPWDLSRVPGGSSGGSAAAVASGMAVMALGSDTGGSIRCPASYCSVVGLKPTYGTVSRYGLVAYSNSLEQIGPIGRTVEETSVLFEVISGSDPKDCTTSGDRPRAARRGVKGMKIGVVREFLGEGVQEGVRETVSTAAEELEGLGASVSELSVASLRYALAAYYVIAMAEASSNLSRFDGVRYGTSLEGRPVDWNEAYSRTRSECFGDEVRRRILLGTFVLSAGYYETYYLKAQGVRRLLRDDFERAFKKFDLLLGPTMPTLPPRLGERVSPLEEYMMDVNTVPANLTGLPAISVPCGFSGGLPVGMQLMAPAFREDLLFSAAGEFERSTDHHRRTPG